MAEIAECHRLGARQVFLVDDNFIGNKKLAKELLRAIAAWSEEHGHPIHFNTEVTLNVAQDDELLAAAARRALHHRLHRHREPAARVAGGDQEDPELRGDLVASVRKIQSYGIQVQAGMIVGFDNDDADHLRRAAAVHPGRAHPGLDDRADSGFQEARPLEIKDWA